MATARYQDDGEMIVTKSRYLDGGDDLAEQLEDILGVVFIQEAVARKNHLSWGA